MGTWGAVQISVLAICGLVLLASGQHAPTDARQLVNMDKELVVEVWSDVVCPFCYIGKRELEAALARFPQLDKVRVVWRSFELDPYAPTRSPEDMYGMLASKYGITREEASSRVQGVVDRARSVGLDYRMDLAVMGSSFDAHRVLQLAKSKGKGDAMKERLFKAYFCEGAHLADHPTLVRLAGEVGIEAVEVTDLLAGDAFTEAVRADEEEARRIGVRGVPFFVFDRRFSVSGAQQSATFLGALQQAWDAR